MAGKVDCVGDQRRRGVGERGGRREDRNGVCYAEREATCSPARRRDAPDAVAQAAVGVAADEVRPVRAVRSCRLPKVSLGREVKRDVAAILSSIGAGERVARSS